ncbi:MAG TPA: hypothetical protein VGE37_05295 [Archangium sp.]
MRARFSRTRRTVNQEKFMTQRPPRSAFLRPTPRGVLTRVSAKSSRHKLSVGPFRGRAVGGLETGVLEDTVDLLKQRLAETSALTPESEKKSLEADLRAVNGERERRWLALVG